MSKKTKPIVALYKLWRGGEWLRASLESIAPHVQAIVAVCSIRSWDGQTEPGNNCLAELEHFSRQPEAPLVHRHYGSWSRQEDQYRDGLRLIEEAFGDVAVLIVDSDEIWPAEDIADLVELIRAQAGTDYFVSRLRAYVKSPLYQVWPANRCLATVALANPRPAHIVGRFCPPPRAKVKRISGAFHHFSYVRGDPEEIPRKFQTTSSQEHQASKASWVSEVYPRLPEGRNLHMTPGCEDCWEQVRVISPDALPAGVRELPFVRRIIAEEEERWRRQVLETAPEDRLIPLANEDDRALYQDLLHRWFSPALLDLLAPRLRTTWLEALWLLYWASQVPPSGRILEIGSGLGGSMTCLGIGAPSAELTAIDPFKPYEETTHAGTVMAEEGDQATFWDTIERAGIAQRVDLIRARSSEVWRNRGRYDLILVDGNHSYPTTFDDLRYYHPLLNPGGRFIVHDHSTGFPGVIQAVADYGLPISVPVQTSLCCLGPTVD